MDRAPVTDAPAVAQTLRGESREAVLAMAFKLVLAGETRWRTVNAPHRLTLVRAGVEFPNAGAERSQSEPAPGDLFTHTPHRCSPPVRCQSTRLDNTSCLEISRPNKEVKGLNTLPGIECFQTSTTTTAT